MNVTHKLCRRIVDAVESAITYKIGVRGGLARVIEYDFVYSAIRKLIEDEAAKQSPQSSGRTLTDDEIDAKFKKLHYFRNDIPLGRSVNELVRWAVAESYPDYANQEKQVNWLKRRNDYLEQKNADMSRLCEKAAAEVSDHNMQVMRIAELEKQLAEKPCGPTCAEVEDFILRNELDSHHTAAERGRIAKTWWAERVKQWQVLDDEKDDNLFDDWADARKQTDADVIAAARECAASELDIRFFTGHAKGLRENSPDSSTNIAFNALVAGGFIHAPVEKQGEQSEWPQWWMDSRKNEPWGFMYFDNEQSRGVLYTKDGVKIPSVVGWRRNATTDPNYPWQRLPGKPDVVRLAEEREERKREQNEKVGEA